MRESIAGSSIALPPRLEDGMRHRQLVAPVDIGDGAAAGSSWPSTPRG